MTMKMFFCHPYAKLHASLETYSATVVLAVAVAIFTLHIRSCFDCWLLWQGSVGEIQLSSGQRYAHINITIVDDSIAEDDKYFYVRLVNPTRGAVTGPASTIKVIILNSDDAYGVVRFDTVSQSLIASESEAQQTNVTLRVSQLTVYIIPSYSACNNYSITHYC